MQVAKDQSVWPIRVNPGVNRGYQTSTLREDGTLAKFTAAEGADLHCEPKAMGLRNQVVFDWLDEILSR